jgi:DNA-binding Lrp family transcriptional regulator
MFLWKKFSILTRDKTKFLNVTSIYCPDSGGCMPIAYVLITCDLGSEENIIKELMKIPQVKEVRGVYGVFDIFAKVESNDMGQLREVVTNGIRRMEKVRTTNTLMAIEEQGGR